MATGTGVDEPRPEQARAVDATSFFGRLQRSQLTAPVLAVAGLTLGLVTQLAYTSDFGPPRKWLGFVVASLLLGAAAWFSSRAAREEEAAGTPPAGFTLSRNWEWGLLAAILVLAAFFRFWRFMDFPPGLWYDEAINGTDALSIIDRDHLTVWRESNFGHSTIFFYLLIVSYWIFDYTVFAMRLVPALAGMAAVFAFYFLARWLVGVVPALIATALFAVSRWAVTFSRISWEASLQPVLEIMAVFFLVRGLETKNKFYFFMAGGSLAAGIYTYLAFRFVPIVMAFFLVYIAVTQWKLLRDNVAGLAIYAVSFILVITPLAQYALQNQDQFLARTRDINVFKEIDEKDSYEPLRHNIRSSIKMVNVEGDTNGRHNLPNEPMADDITAALFALGFGVAILSLRQWRKGAMAGWFVLALTPGVFTISVENPSAIRGVGAIPPLYLLVGLAVATMYGAMNRTRAGLIAFGGIAVVLVAVSTVANYDTFFDDQLNDIAVYDGFTPEYTQVGELVADEAGDKDVWVSRDFHGHPAVRVLGRGETFHMFTAPTNFILPNTGRDVVVITDVRQLGAVETWRRLYPNLTQTDHIDPFERVYWSRLDIPASDVAALHELPMTLRVAGDADAAPEASRAAITRDWTEDDLAGGPIEATWRGYVWVPAASGSTVFSVRAPGRAELEIDGRVFLADPAGVVNTGGLTLPPGEHEVRITATIERPGQVAIDASVPQVDNPRNHDLIYANSVGEQGFRVIYREGRDFSNEPSVLGHAPFAIPMDIAASVRAIEYQGIFEATAAGTYGFALDGANSAQLFVDDTLLVDNGGSHGERRVEGFVPLQPGPHEITIQYTIPDRPHWALFIQEPGAEWVRATGNEFSVPTTPYTPPAIVRLEPDQAWGANGRTYVEGGVTGVDVRPDGSGIVVASPNALLFIDRNGNLQNTVDAQADDITDIAIADDGRIVAVDNITRSLLIYDSEGNLQKRMDGVFSTALGVDVFGEHAYVASPAGGLVYRVLLGGDTVELLPLSSENAPVRALQPSDVAAADDGTLYIPDFDRKTIVKASADGSTAVSYPGVSGTGRQLPHMATYRGVVLLTDPLNARILIYDRDAKQRGVFTFARTAAVPRPLGIATSRDGEVYVADIENGLVFKMTLEVPLELEDELTQQ